MGRHRGPIKTASAGEADAVGLPAVALMMSFRVAPPGCFSKSRTWAVLLPWRSMEAVSDGVALSLWTGADVAAGGGCAPGSGNLVTGDVAPVGVCASGSGKRA